MIYYQYNNNLIKADFLYIIQNISTQHPTPVLEINFGELKMGVRYRYLLSFTISKSSMLQMIWLYYRMYEDDRLCKI